MDAIFKIASATSQCKILNDEAFDALSRPRQQFILLLWICICMVKKKIANNQY